MDWSAAHYVKFEDERTRPARDLVARIPLTDVARAVDLGCGPGNSAEILLERFPGADLLGIDTSPDMLEAARQRLPAAGFRRADISAWAAEAEDRFDVILSNAALHWVPRHDGLLPALLRRLAPGGCLAVQMPDNLDEPTHRLMAEVAAAGPWRGRMPAVPRPAPNPPAWYFAALRAAGAAVDLWRTTYFHPLAGVEAVVAWLKATGLRPYLEPLSADEQAAFLEAYRLALASAYPVQADGTVLLPFPRLFFTACVK